MKQAALNANLPHTFSRMSGAGLSDPSLQESRAEKVCPSPEGDMAPHYRLALSTWAPMGESGQAHRPEEGLHLEPRTRGTALLRCQRGGTLTAPVRRPDTSHFRKSLFLLSTEVIIPTPRGACDLGYCEGDRLYSVKTAQL